nr:hypothetical protein [Sporichthyaceae bacterium]
PVDVAAASARGAALLGARGAGLLDEQALLGLLAPVGEPSATPRTSAASFYAERQALFRRRVDALRGERTRDEQPDV